jgi:hypothetical protein
MSHNLKTILLAGPSLLYAPVLLAKYGRLSPVFDHVKLDWEPERREATWQNSSAYRDPLLAALLEKNRDDEVVIAVCDPCRVGYLPDVGGCHKPCLLSGLIKRACLNYGTLGDEEFGSDDEIFKHVGEIIVNKPGMTSFSITAELLELLDVTPDLFHGVPIGLERTEALARTLVRKKTSSEQAVLFSSLSSPDATASGQNRSVCDLKLNGRAAGAVKRYESFLFTGLLTHEEFRASAPHFLREITSGISFAIRVIEANARAAAEELWRASDLRRALERDVDFDQAVVFLERMVADEVFECCVEPAFDDQTPYRISLRHAIETHEAARWATDILKNEQRLPFDARKVWDLVSVQRSAPLVFCRCERSLFRSFWKRPSTTTVCCDCGKPLPNEASMLSADRLLKVPPGARANFFIGLITLFVMGALFLAALGWCDIALISARPTIAAWEKTPIWQAVLSAFDPHFENYFRTEKRQDANASHIAPSHGDLSGGASTIPGDAIIDPGDSFEGDRVQKLMGLVFSFIGCFLLAFLERPRRRNTRGYGVLDWLFFLGGMGVLLIGVRALSDGPTMVNTLFGWGAIFYAFARLARHPLPNPVKFWRASRQRSIGIYEFRRALRQSAWESKEPGFACKDADHPSRVKKIKMRARMRWHQTGGLLSLVLGGQWSGWFAGLRLRIIFWLGAMALLMCQIWKPDWLPFRPLALWLSLLLFVVTYLFLKWLTLATPLTWGGWLQERWNWVRWQCYRPLWGPSGFRDADKIQ